MNERRIPGKKSLLEVEHSSASPDSMYFTQSFNWILHNFYTFLLKISWHGHSVHYDLGDIIHTVEKIGIDLLTPLTVEGMILKIWNSKAEWKPQKVV